MRNKSMCRECGAITVSQGPEPTCFSCQIAAITAPADDSSDSFFVDFGDEEPNREKPSQQRLTQVPGYEIEKPLDAGGMGIVYIARHLRLGRRVALKVLPTYLEKDRVSTSRFEVEARALAWLDHPGIVRVHDFGKSDEGIFFLVMELVEGKTLREMQRKTKLGVQDICGYAIEICEALAYAHGEGVVHRDIKPENVLLDRFNRVKIVDFGVAKLAGGDDEARLTRTHQIVGTPLYMAPEQFDRPREVDFRADLYAVGAMMYEMLTGEPPSTDPLPPSRSMRIDPRLDSLVMTLIAHDPADRPQSAEEVAMSCRRIAIRTTARRQASPTAFKRSISSVFRRVMGPLVHA